MAAPAEFIWCFVIIFAAFCSTSSSNRTLKLTHVLFRHGNRSPIKAYPSDPYQEDTWPQGFGQLTQEGMRQHYELGKWLRQRYVTDSRLLNSSYVRTEIHVHSTAYDRTLMSAQSNLAGLYPPQGRQMWNEQLSWQPIPVFTKPTSENHLLVADNHLDCPRLEELGKENEKLHVHEDYISKNKDFFDTLAKHAGYDVSNVTYQNFTRIADSWYFEIRDGRSLPTWATQDIIDRVLPMLDFSYASEVQNEEYFRLRSGTLLNEVVTHFKAVTEGTETTKLYMYSGHDDNVAWLLRSLNVFNNLGPPPASCVMIELYLEDDKSYTVDVLFKNNTKAEPIKLPMPGTKGPCTLDHFFEITKDCVVTDAVTACKAQGTSGHNSGFLPKTWNTGFLPFAASQRAFQWLVIFSLLTIVVLLASLRKGCRFLRNLNNNVKLRLFSPPARPDV
ncbi:prostatic acid phosphatase-like isoform X2 [Patiria miniata]|uniref:Acid phosphatase n=1 Tax=Patiria miniata TaxID=46514 RepID=A0A913ZDH8_PATMI|nr:prostatic acid phosphatase-like isoform X2 [Patiria miniata]